MKKQLKGEVKLTTVKVFEDKYHRFKEMNVDSQMTLQKLVNRSLALYLENDDYRDVIDRMLELQESGSSY